MRLNAEKCTFGVCAGKFLGYLISTRGIEANPSQIKAVNRLKLSSNPKEVQVLTGMLAALNRFISKFADRCRPFYQLLKKWKGFQWDEECDKAFRDLKEYLAQVPMLMAPKSREDLFMYLSVSNHAVSAMLLRDQRVQQPMYYISKTLVDAETRYLPLEKLVLDARHEEAVALLSGSYCVHPHRVSPTIIVKKIRLHEPNSQVGNSVGFIRHKVPVAKLGERIGSC